MRATVLLMMILSALAPAARAQDNAPSPTDRFAEALDLRPLSVTAVHHEGRLTSFDSFAYKVMKRVTGSRGIEGRTHAFTLLDMPCAPRPTRDATASSCGRRCSASTSPARSRTAPG